MIPDSVRTLVERFDEQKADYKKTGYNETQVRREFIDPLFKALGWDVDNEAGYSESYKDVFHEARVRIDTSDGRTQSKAPDYAFRIGGVRKFFVEAKKPSVDIKTDIHPAFQVRRYAWSDPNVPLAILTDFEEFAVYDGRVKPHKKDSAGTARVFYCTYDQYAEKWDEIADTFSRDSILKGRFDRYADDTKKRGTEAPGDAFLKEIEGWRERLAADLAKGNPSLSARELSGAVQRTIDRIVFLRIAEDRGIEPVGELKTAVKGKNSYRRLVELFRAADARYNSGLFHFSDEKDRPGDADTLTPGLKLSDATIRGIVSGLYFPESPYAFDVFPADLLGQVYERFLGKTIRLDGKKAVIDDKPEVKKAGGVYYTPTYVVDYIVRQTLAPLLDGISDAKLKAVSVLDPACGSGSFLLGAYDFLLRWYLERYTADDPERHARGRPPRLVKGADDAWRLSLDEKKRILTTHLYGVDIDAQAVEVTKLSLLLKLLEGETQATISPQLSLLTQRILPELSDNVRCGNSLVGPDFYDGHALDLFSDDDHYRINAFDWHAEFATVMDRGGFDAVVGNPPYVRIQTMTQWAAPEVAYIKSHYRSAAKGNFDLYVAFVEQGLQLMGPAGRMGYILPHKFFNAKYGQALRGLVTQGDHLDAVVHFGHQQVFDGASTYTALLFLTSAANASFRYADVDDLDAWRTSLADASTPEAVAAEGQVPAERISDADWTIVAGPGADVFYRIGEMPRTLADVTSRIFQGLKTSADKVYIVHENARTDGKMTIFSPETEREYTVEADLFHPLVKGGDSKAYRLTRTDRRILFPYETRPDGDAGLIPADELAERFPLTWAYLTANRAVLEARERGKMKDRTGTDTVVSKGARRDAAAQAVHARPRPARRVRSRRHRGGLLYWRCFGRLRPARGRRSGRIVRARPAQQPSARLVPQKDLDGDARRLVLVRVQVHPLPTHPRPRPDRRPPHPHDRPRRVDDRAQSAAHPGVRPERDGSQAPHRADRPADRRARLPTLRPHSRRNSPRRSRLILCPKTSSASPFYLPPPARSTGSVQPCAVPSRRSTAPAESAKDGC